MNQCTILSIKTSGEERKRVKRREGRVFRTSVYLERNHSFLPPTRNTSTRNDSFPPINQTSSALAYCSIRLAKKRERERGRYERGERGFFLSNVFSFRLHIGLRNSFSPRTPPLKETTDCSISIHRWVRYDSFVSLSGRKKEEHVPELWNAGREEAERKQESLSRV